LTQVPIPLLIAWGNPFDELVFGLHFLLVAINGAVHNYGWSIILLAGLVKGALWPLSSMQLRSMSEMQKLAPQIQALKNKYKDKDAETAKKLNLETMALYKEHNVNPFAGCLPALLPIPIMFAFWQVIMRDDTDLVKASWLWIGSSGHAFSDVLTQIPLLRSFVVESCQRPWLFGWNLFDLDFLLLGLYMISMFFTMRTAAPPMDEQQAQQQKMMAFLSPTMLGYFGWRNAWPSALILYWLTFNIFSMLQQMYVQGRFTKATSVPLPAGDDVLAAGKNQDRQVRKKNVATDTRATRKKRARR
jgi:YidC/Oxa1 family membrane protein insertase